MSNLGLWYTRIDIDELMAEIRRQATKDMKANVKRAEANVAKGRTKDSMKAFGKLTLGHEQGVCVWAHLGSKREGWRGRDTR